MYSYTFMVWCLGPVWDGMKCWEFLTLLTFQLIFRHIWWSEKQKNSCFLSKSLDCNNVQYVFVRSFSKCCFFFLLEFSICRVYFHFMHFIVLALCLWMFLSLCTWSVLWHQFWRTLLRRCLLYTFLFIVDTNTGMKLGEGCSDTGARDVITCCPKHFCTEDHSSQHC
jgi:hypothetical protein